MAYAKRFIQLTWGGSYFTDDIWINGLHIIVRDGIGETNLDEVFDVPTITALSARVMGAHTNLNGNSSQAQLEWIKMAMIGTDGKYEMDPLILDLNGAQGGRSTMMYPQLATAVTLRTEKKRGPSAYGRYYTPTALPVGPTGTAIAGDLDEFLNVQQVLLTGLNMELANSAVQNDVVLGNVSKVGTGSQEEITGVFVGNLVDTQRRRRNKLNEVYAGLTL